MRPLHFILALIAIIILAFLCARCDGERIQAACLAEAENSLTSADISWATIDVDGRRLTLSGEAPSEDARTLAIETLTDNAECVDMRYFSDTTTVRAAASPYVTTLVKTEDDRITLSGYAPDETEHDWLSEQAVELVGDDRVTNELVLASGYPDDWRAAMAVVSSQISGYDQATATLTDTTLVVQGSVGSAQARDQLETAIRSALPASITPSFAVTAPAGITALATDDYQTSYDFDGSRVRLGGFVPDEDSRSWLVGEANDHVGVPNVDDELAVAGGAPQGWRGAMSAVTGHVRQYDRARASLQGESLNIEGDAENSPMRDLTQSTIVGKLPSGFSANFNITTPEDGASMIALNQQDVSCQGELNTMLSGEVVLFDFDSAAVKREAEDLLRKVGLVLGTCPDAAIDIIGRTDPRGTEEYNLRLSQRRADSVAAYLGSVNVSDARMRAVGYGETVPLSEDEAGLAQARRVEFVVTKR